MSRRRLSLKSILTNYNSIVIFIFLLVAASFFVNRFPRNYPNIIYEASIYGCIAIALALVMITGNIDLSVGYQAAVGAVVVVLVINATGSVIAAIIAAVVAGIIMGAINGMTVTVLGISPLIATISTNYIYKGVVYYFTKNGSIYPEGELKNALKNSLTNLQLFDMKFLAITVIIVAVIIVVLSFVLHRTNFGNNLYITGDNPEAGTLAGIKPKRMSFFAYVICGALCGLAGAFLASNSGAATYTLGEGRDVFAISACVIGGVKMAGGKGTMLNVLIGILIMRMISTAMNLMLLPSSWVSFISGVLLLLVLIIDKVTAVKKEA